MVAYLRSGKRGTAACFLVGWLGLAVWPQVAAALCVEFDKPEELFALSDAVFVGTVVANEPTGAKGDHDIVDVATLRVEKVWKGNLGRDVRVGSDVPFENGKKYVVFAAGKPLSTTILCRAAETVDRAARKLDWLATRRSRPAKRAGR